MCTCTNESTGVPVIQQVSIEPHNFPATVYSLTVDLPGPPKGKRWIIKSIGALLQLNSIQAGLEPTASFFSVVPLNQAAAKDPAASVGTVSTALDYAARGSIMSKGTDCSIYRGSVATVITANVWNTGVVLPFGYKLRLVYTPEDSATGINVQGTFGVNAIEIAE